MVMLTDVLQNGILQAPKPTVRSLICAFYATIREPKRFVRQRRDDPGSRGSTHAVQFSHWTGQSVWAFACATGTLAGGRRSVVPDSNPQTKSQAKHELTLFPGWAEGGKSDG